MILTVLSTLLLTAPADAAFVAPQPQQQPCPWNTEALTLLYPSDGAIAFTNTSIWLRGNDGVTAIGEKNPVLEDENGAFVPANRTDLDLPTGALIELRPIEQLDPGHQYRVRWEQKIATFTAGGPLLGTPAIPVVESIVPIEQAPINAACDTSGVLITSARDNAQLHLFLADNGDLLGSSVDEHLVVVGTPGTQVCGTLIAMDAVGRRSAPSDRVCAVAKNPPAPTGGRQRVDDVVLGCSTTAGGADAAMMLVLIGAIALIAKQKKRTTCR